MITEQVAINSFILYRLTREREENNARRNRLRWCARVEEKQTLEINSITSLE